MSREKGKKRGGTPNALADLIGVAYPSREPEEAALIRAFSWWCKAVPERVSQRARPVKILGTTLLVHCATTAWAQELEYLREPLVQSIQKHAPFARVRDIRFRVGPLPELPRSTREERARPSPIPLAVLPDELARVLASIDDDDLRDVIGHAASISLGREKKG